ncbi:LysR family transcriptional regulator [Erysipelothrix sp. HDW6B]|uniref:LysR family transcriptional regulator n=1 Tax=Erysipelothrix sp. HDW6B TaxID=2714929 RepID=UPI00140BEB4C|nr:LysR family transcriptional regulator [Erysipelothrix sp. HDW6B]QIK86642.1 LysR family transcriptional regulator [Erysipelothrix sp. HDW6B]
MSLNKWRIYITAVDFGSLSKAAEKMGYTPSGVSQMISSLEDEIGIPLLVRSSRGVIPSKGATELLPTIRDLLKAEEKLSQVTSSIRGMKKGSITIGSYPSIAIHWLPKLIKEFQIQFPDIEFKIMEGLKQEIVSWLEEGITDISLMTLGEGINYDWIPLAKDPMIAVLPKNHEKAKYTSYQLKWYKNEHFIMPAMGRDDDVVRLLEKYQLDVNIAHSTLENISTLAMIEQDMGMSIMNELITKRWDCDVVKLPLDPPEYIEFGIAFKPASIVTPVTERFVSFVKENIELVSENYLKRNEDNKDEKNSN